MVFEAETAARVFYYKRRAFLGEFRLLLVLLDVKKCYKGIYGATVGQSEIRLRAGLELGPDIWSRQMSNMSPSEKEPVKQINRGRSGSARFEQVRGKKTEGKTPEAEVSTDSNKLDAIFGAFQDGITILDSDYTITYQNEVSLNLFGDRRGEKCYRVFEERDGICDDCPVESAFNDGQSHTSIRERVLPSGEISYWESVANPIRDDEGNVVSCLEISKNITERRRKDGELLVQKQRLEDVTNSVQCALMLLDSETRIIYVNSLGEKWFGALDEIRGKCCCEILNLDRNQCAAWKLLETGETAEGEVFDGIIEGERRFFYTVASPVQTSDGKIEEITLAIIDMTAQKTVEDELKTSEAAFRNVFDNTLLGLYRTTPDGRILMANPALLRMLGYASSEALSKRNLEDEGFEAEYPRSLFKERIEAEGKIVGLESSWTRHDGTTLYVRESAKAVRDGDGNTLYYEGTVEDISERKKAEEKLLYRLAFEHLIMGISADLVHLKPGEIDAGIREAIASVGKFARADRSYIFQFRENGRLVDNTHEWCAPEIESQMENLQGISLNEELPWFTYKILTENVFYVPSVKDLPSEAELEKEHFKNQDIQSLIVIPLRSGDSLTGFIGFASVRSKKEWSQDIIDLLRITGQTISSSLVRNKAERALKESEEKYRSLITNIPDVVWTTNSQGKTVFISQNIEEVYGYSADEICGSCSGLWFERIHPDDAAKARSTFNALFEQSAEYDIEYRIRRKDGEWIWLRDRSIATYEKDSVLYADGIFTDITERKKAEEELRLQEKRLELFFSQSLDGFFFMMIDEPVAWDDSVDKDKVLDYVFEHQRITKINDAMAGHYGASREHFIGMTPSDFYAHDIDYGREIWRQFFDVGRLHIETEERKLDGTPVWIEGDYICLYDEEGRITGHFGIQRDITESKRALENIEQSERRYRELIENMTSGVAVYEAVDDGADFVFKDFNRAGESIDCVRREDLIGKRVTAVFPGVNDLGLLEVFRRVYKTGRPEFCPKGLYEDDRISGWRENRVYKLPTGEIVSIYNDITERKQIEEELRLDESRFEALLKLSQMTDTPLRKLADFALAEAVKLTNSDIGFIGFLDEEETVMTVHAWSKQVMGQCAIKDKPLDFPLDKAGIWADAVRIRKAVIVNAYSAEDRSKKGCPEGHVPLTRVMSVPVFDGDRIAAVIAVANKKGEYAEADARQLSLLGDGVWKAAQRMKAENELKASEEKYRFLFDAVPSGIGIADFDGNILDCNRAMSEMLDYSIDELRSINIKEVYAYPEKRRELIEAVKKRGAIRNWEHELRTKDGSIRSLLLNVDLIERDGGKVLLTTCRDVTDRKKAEDLVRQMAVLPKLNPSPVLRLDSDGVIKLSNEAAVEILGDGVSKEARLKDVLPDLAHINLKRCIEQGLVLTEEVRIKDRYYQFIIRGVSDLGLAQAYGSNITERKKAENALKKAHGELEGRVFQRTMELAGTNQELKSEVAERRVAEKALAKELEVSRRRQAEVSALLEGSRVVLEHRTFEDAARKLFDSCKNLTGAASGYVALLKDDGSENEVLYLDPGGATCSVAPSLPMPIRGFREVVYRTGEPAYENSFSQSDWMKFIPAGHVRLDSVLFAPMKIKGKVVGLLGLGNKPGGFSDSDTRMAGAFAELAAVALKNSQTLGALQKSQEELSQARDHLEDLVEDRTAELQKSNKDLEKQIAGRRKAVKELENKQKQLKTLTSELALAEERERRRIAVGIHDNIGQKMALAKLELQSSMTSARDNGITESLESVCDRIDEAIKDSHSLTFELSNPALYELSFDAAIEQWLLEQIQKNQNIKCEVSANIEPVELGLNLKIVLFQAIRELAVNVVKYAGARRLNVKINKGKDRIVIKVKDDGIGFVPSEGSTSISDEKGGFGLFNIRERLEHLGGAMKIKSSPTKGTTITLRVPLEQH